MKQRNTAELHYLYKLIAYAVLAAVWLVIGFALLTPVNGAARMSPAALAIVVCFFGVIILYHLVQYVRYRSMRFTDIQEVKLEHVSSESFFRLVGFDITVERGGQAETVTTKPVFSVERLVGKLSLSNYAGYVHKVSYNEKSGEWIVLL